jgi:hypothetical protein
MDVIGIVQCDLTGRCRSAHHMQHGRVTGLDAPYAIEDIISYTYLVRP